MKKILAVVAILFVVANVAVFSVQAYKESNYILENEINTNELHPRHLEEVTEEVACYRDGKPCDEEGQ